MNKKTHDAIAAASGTVAERIAARRTARSPLSSVSTAIGGPVNRVADAVAVLEARLTTANATPAKLAELNATFNIDMDEFCVFQNKKSLAAANGTLTLDEANYVYAQLGTSPVVFNARPLPVKVAITKLMAELLGS